ncbi:hypothetical protein LRS06_13480 [Hymenobacter sp. J193]|uniref:hypothetical protein n=1 Tax=Hymenobacter sp. J193 TaxID=2898429 RepID=UPI002151F186|nr:hypothetical protein [Hymenobacter sp. J193]MCR5888761.1 hypothetical protein [Hymenobacter sp. J193]
MPLLDFTQKPSQSKELQLLHLLQTRDNVTMLQAVRELYGSGSAVNQTALRKLKSRVQHKLFSNLFFLDYTDARHPVYRRYEQECLDLLYQAGVLLREGEYVVSEKLYRRCQRLAAEGEFNQHEVTSLLGLRQIYAEQRQAGKYRHAVKQLVAAERLLQLEQKASEIFWEAKMMLSDKVRIRQQLLAKLPEFVRQMEALYDQAPVFRVYDHLYKLRLMQQELSGDYEGIIQTTSESEKLWEAGKLNAKRFDRRYNMFYSVFAHLQARRLQAGLELAAQYLSAFHRSSGNWFVFMEHYLLLAMHASEYGKATELLKMAFDNPFFSKLRTAAQQRWELYRAYLYFVAPENLPVRNLHFAQLMHVLPEYSRDKQGLNVAILILQFLYYLKQRNLEEVLSRLEGLRKYAGTHLREAAALRGRLFFRLLQLTVTENFDEALCRRKGQPLLAKLAQTPMPGEAFAGIEIIPYENLWQLTLHLMQQVEQ